MNRLLFIYLTLFGFSISPAFGASDSTALPTVSVIGFKAKNGDTALARSLAELIESRLSKRAVYRVVSRSDVAAILTENNLTAPAETSDDALMVRLKSIGGIQKVITGALGSIGATSTIVLKLIDIQSQVVERSVCRQYAGQPEGLFQVAGAMVDELVDNGGAIVKAHDSVVNRESKQHEESPGKEVCHKAAAENGGSDRSMQILSIGAAAIFGSIAIILLANSNR
jgi:hypothetical protein